jgi:hypothetical protein
MNTMTSSVIARIIARTRGNPAFSILFTNGFRIKKQKSEITRGSVTDAAYFSTTPTAMALSRYMSTLEDFSDSVIKIL